MKKRNEFMVKAEEALQKEFAKIIGDDSAELPDKKMGNMVGGLDVQWIRTPPIKPSAFEWKPLTYTLRCKKCGKTKTVTMEEGALVGLENDCSAGFDSGGCHEYEMME